MVHKFAGTPAIRAQLYARAIGQAIDRDRKALEDERDSVPVQVESPFLDLCRSTVAGHIA
jgi:hypothetical protein